GSVVTPPIGFVNALSGGLAAIGPSDVWAGGEWVETNGHTHSLIEHWNGSSWTIATLPTPPPGTFDEINDVAAVGPDDVWALGSYQPLSGPLREAFALHWDGGTWSLSYPPNPRSGQDGLFGLAAVSSSSVWAVGFSSDGVDTFTLTERWNGSAWDVVKSPNPTNQGLVLRQVDGSSNRDLWTVGAYYDLGDKTLTEHRC